MLNVKDELNALEGTLGDADNEGKAINFRREGAGVVPVNLDGWEVTVSHVPYPPGRVGTAHKHAGFVLAYVVEGAVVTKVSDQGPERVYKAGEMFYEQPGATHEVSKNASQTEPAKLLALIFAPKGATLTTQVKE